MAKVLVWLLFWTVGYISLVVLIGAPVTGRQIAGGAALIALLVPVQIRMEQPW